MGVLPWGRRNEGFQGRHAFRLKRFQKVCTYKVGRLLGANEKGREKDPLKERRRGRENRVWKDKEMHPMAKGREDREVTSPL